MLTIDTTVPRAPKRRSAFPAITRSSRFAGATLLYVAASLAAGTTVAQENAPQSTASGEVLDQVTVTGSRIVRDGYSAPTPVSVLGTEALDAMAVTNIGEAVNRLPVFGSAVTSRNSSPNVGSGTAGVNFLNLRGLSATRTLVLLDGKRVVGSTVTGFHHDGGAVDINGFPAGLIKRVEVVTGGASAVYGSDALAGVVNFILDKDYTGFKGTVQGGATSHGDGENYRASFTAGMPFAEGRGHFLFSGEHAYEGGILGKPRDWADTSYQLIRNPNYTPTNGQPLLMTAFDVGSNIATRGGLILSCPSAPSVTCPLRGTQFLGGGTPAPFEFGPIMSGIAMSGGDWETSRVDRVTNLAIDVRRDTAFTRTSYDITDSTTVYATLQWSKTVGDNDQGVYNFNLGGVTIQSGNPFIPDSVQAQMTALGIPSFTMGTMNGDLGSIQPHNERTFSRYVAGLEGEVGVMDTDWQWDAYYSRSTNDVLATSPNNRINANYARAVDAVINNGQIVCRVNADADPANDDPACVPYNPMGTGVNSSAAIDYIMGMGHRTSLLEQDVVALSATGEPFSSWAAPISLAFGAAHRREAVSGSASALDEADSFFAGNYKATQGAYDVTEGFIETVVPLAAGQPLAESLDISGALRWTDYSTSGEVVTWKLGATWAPIDDMNFRVTRSRDIRAPNLGDLFNAGTSGRSTIFDPFTNTTADIITRETGNPNLEPEEADAIGIGVVLTPSFLPGFAASVDYYDIEIKGAIASLGSQGYVNRCFEGITSLCSFIQRDADGFIEFIIDQPANVLSQNTDGFDLELSYTFPLSFINSNWDGEFAFRALGTYVGSLETVDAQGVIDGAGVNSNDIGMESGNALNIPSLRYLLSATYENHPLAATLIMRGIGSGVYDNAFIECVSNCPPATAAHPTINNNHIDAVTYFDLAFKYAAFGDTAEIFFVAENVLDEDPPLIAGTAFYVGQGNSRFYDRLGRVLRAGVRFYF